VTRPYLEQDVTIVDALVHRARATDVDTVIVAGTPVIREGRFTRIDRDEVIERLAASLDRPLRPHEVARRELSRLLFPHVQRFYDDWRPDEGRPFYQVNQR